MFNRRQTLGKFVSAGFQVHYMAEVQTCLESRGGARRPRVYPRAPRGETAYANATSKQARRGVKRRTLGACASHVAMYPLVEKHELNCFDLVRFQHSCYQRYVESMRRAARRIQSRTLQK